MIRLFAGLSLPPDVTARLTVLSGGIPGARWIEGRNLHITLHFMGEMDEAAASDLHDGLAAIHAHGFDLSLNGFGTFGRSAPNHLWAGVEKAPGLLALQAKVEQVAIRLGLDHDGRKYLPHVTLARFRAAPVGRVQDFIAGRSPFLVGPWVVDHFVLFQSHLGHGGAEYEAIAEYPLA